MTAKAYEELSLNGEVLENVSKSFEDTMQKLLKNMSKSGSDEGSIAIKIDVKIEPMEATDPDGNPQMISSPVFKHTITSTVPVKSSEGGSNSTKMALVFDDVLQRYVLKRADIDGQMNIFDAMNDPEEDEEKKALPGPSNQIEKKEDDYDYEEPEDEPQEED